MKKIILVFFFSVCMATVYSNNLLWAQNWDIAKPLDVRDGIAQVISIDRGLAVVNLRFYTTPAAGEFKDISCYFDKDASLIRLEQAVPFLELRVGDRLVLESGIFEKQNRSCRQMTFVDDAAPPVVQEENVPSFGNTLARVESINRDLQSASIKFYPSKDLGEFEVFSCFIDEDSYLEKDGKKISLDELKTGEWVAAETERLNSSQRSCGPLKVIENSSAIISEDSEPVFGDGIVQLLSMDFSLQTVSLKIFGGDVRGGYEVFSCYVEKDAYLEKNGRSATLADFTENDWILFNTGIVSSGQRSCGNMKVVPKPDGF